MATTLTEALQAAGDARDAGAPQLDPAQLAWLGSAYAGAIARMRADNQPGRTELQQRGLRLAERFEVHREMILRFVHDLSVPFTNNAAEREIRPVKVKQRTAGGCLAHPARTRRLRRHLVLPVHRRKTRCRCAGCADPTVHHRTLAATRPRPDLTARPLRPPPRTTPNRSRRAVRPPAHTPVWARVGLRDVVVGGRMTDGWFVVLGVEEAPDELGGMSMTAMPWADGLGGPVARCRLEPDGAPLAAPGLALLEVDEQSALVIKCLPVHPVRVAAWRRSLTLTVEGPDQASLVLDASEVDLDDPTDAGALTDKNALGWLTGPMPRHSGCGSTRGVPRHGGMSAPTSWPGQPIGGEEPADAFWLSSASGTSRLGRAGTGCSSIRTPSCHCRNG